MKAVLERLFSIRGMRAAAAFDPSGVLLASHGDEIAAKLERMGSALAANFSTLPFSANVSSTILRFEGGTLVVRRNADVMLAVVGDAKFDVTERGAAVPLNGALVALRSASKRPSKPIPQAT